ncbi:MAG: NADPH-dependent ferric siderophore reductase [Parvibaculaceae bacterium]|jgi:NADPH-dependent ferric siderophore reductase
MTVPPFKVRTDAKIAGAPAVVAKLVSHLKEHDFIPAQNEPSCVTYETDFGTLWLKSNDDTVTVELETQTEANQWIMQQFAARHLQELAPNDLKIVWQGHQISSSLPPNARIMRFLRQKKISPTCIRITLGGEDLQYLSEEGLHFRLFSPKNRTRAPVWPRIQTDGTTTWPQGEDELSNRVFTIRYISADEMTFDLITHPKGQAIDWINAVKPGDEVLVTGPGGGYFPPSDKWLLMGGDETALPALARILENLPATATGHVIIETAGHQSRQPIKHPANVKLEWVDKDTAPQNALLDRLCAITPPQNTPTYGWFAGEFAQAQAMRKHFKSFLDKKQQLSVAYWTRNASQQ